MTEYELSDEHMEAIFNQYASFRRGPVFEIPVISFFETCETRFYSFLKYRLEWMCERRKIDAVISMDYNGKKYVIFMKGDCHMFSHYQYTLEIPYGSRSKYYKAMQELNELSDQFCGIFVNNDPYVLESYLVISTTINSEKIEKVISSYRFTLKTDKGLPEFIKEMGARKWNSATFPEKATLKDIREMAEPMFFFSEKSDMVKHGYDMSFQKSRKKLFVSYSHANKETVKNIVDEILRHGLNCWLDEREIDVGENILEAVQNGMHDADLALIFISSATKTALFAQHELKTFWKELIYKKKNWFIVKLDDVNPDEILHGLSDYKYYDYSDTNDIEKLLEALNKKLHKLEIID